MPRRRGRTPPEKGPRPADHSPLLPRGDFVLAGLLGVGALLAVVIVVLISRNNGKGDEARPASTLTPAAVVSLPDPADAQAIEALARLSIEVLPKGEWPTLYDSYTSAFRERCPKEQFDKVGDDAAQQMGQDFGLLAFKRLDQLAVTGDSATAVIAGEVRGKSEYTLSAAFQREAGAWKIAPVPGVEGCAAFQRLSG